MPHYSRSRFNSARGGARETFRSATIQPANIHKKDGIKKQMWSRTTARGPARKIPAMYKLTPEIGRPLNFKKNIYVSPAKRGQASARCRLLEPVHERRRCSTRLKMLTPCRAVVADGLSIWKGRGAVSVGRWLLLVVAVAMPPDLFS